MTFTTDSGACRLYRREMRLFTDRRRQIYAMRKEDVAYHISRPHMNVQVHGNPEKQYIGYGKG